MLAMLLVAASVAAAEPVAELPPAAHAPASFTVRGGRITAELQGVPRDEALRELATTLGADVWGEVQNPVPVSHRFDEASVARTLDRLLGAQNFILRYDGDGRLARIELLGLALPRATPNGSRPGQRGRPATFDQLLARHRPVPVTGNLRTAARRDTAPLPQLIALAILQPDPAVRAEAARTVLRAIEGDASLRQAMLVWLRSADAASVAALAQQRARIRAADVLGLVAREARTPLLRTRAAQGLAQLRAPTSTARR